MKELFKNKLIIVMIIIICVLGFYGFYVDDKYDIINAIYLTISLFFFNWGAITQSIYANIAKALAMLVTTSFINDKISDFINLVKNKEKTKKGISTLLYGDNELTKEFISNYKNDKDHYIINNQKFIEANRYILLSSDEDNMTFYNKYKLELANKEVYIKNEALGNTIIKDHHFFSLNQIASRKFYKEYTLLNLAFQDGKIKDELNIVFVGFNQLAKCILEDSLNINIFSSNQKVKYHIFSNKEHEKNLYVNRKILNLTFYNESILANLKLFEEADVVFFFNEKDELIELCGSVNKCNVILFTKDEVDTSLISDNKNGKNNNISIKTFNYIDNISTEQEIVNQNSIKNAIKLNENYNKSNNLLQDLDALQQWRTLSAFHKSINIACIEYYTNTTIRLLEMKYNKPYQEISDSEFKEYNAELSELEHIRWCNFHYIRNWTYNETTNKGNKQHNCLVPFKELTQEEKDKDTVQINKIRTLYNSDK